MSLLFGVAILLITNTVLAKINDFGIQKVKKLPDTYKDVFIPGSGKKPALGTSSSTCWARGGICVDIMRCPSLKMDVGVPGCSWGYKVCCVIHKMLSPTAGTLRRAHLPIIRIPEDLGSNLVAIAERNSLAVSYSGDKGQDQAEDEEEHVDVEPQIIV